MNGTDEFLLNSSDQQKKDGINTVLSAYRSILGPVSFVSMPITGGQIYYDVLDKHDGSITKEQMIDLVIKPNCVRGVNFAKSIAPMASFPVLVPSVLEAENMRWSDSEYMYLWYHVIEEKAQEIWMSPGWEYSNGSSQEFTRAIKMRKSGKPIVIRDYFGEEMRLTDGVDMLAASIGDLHTRGYDCTQLAESLRELSVV
jgi:hypothetical protein